MVTRDFLKQCLKYDPLSGEWTRLVKMGERHPVGSPVGSICVGGSNGLPYRIIGIAGRRYRSARLAWFYMTGEWPVGLVDHKDCDSLNDRFENLRVCDHSENARNRRRGKANKSGHKGVCWYAKYKCWVASIKVAGKTVNLGRFENALSAAAAYRTASQKYHGEFGRA